MKGLKKIELTTEKMKEIVEDYINASMLHPDSALVTVDSIDHTFGNYTVNLEEKTQAGPIRDTSV